MTVECARCTVECGRTVESTYRIFGPKNIALSKCVSLSALCCHPRDPHDAPIQPYCGRFADKYVEFETLVGILLARPLRLVRAIGLLATLAVARLLSRFLRSVPRTSLSFTPIARPAHGSVRSVPVKGLVATSVPSTNKRCSPAAELTTTADALLEVLAEPHTWRIAPRTAMTWVRSGIILRDGEVYVNTRSRTRITIVEEGTKLPSTTLAEIEVFGGECAVAFHGGVAISCLGGRVGVKGDGVRLELERGQRTYLYGKGSPSVREEYFPLTTYSWMLPLIDIERTPDEYRRWYRDLLLALGDTKGSTLAHDAIVKMGAAGRPLVVDYLHNNRMLRRADNYGRVAALLPDLYELAPASDSEVESLFDLLVTTRLQPREFVAAALQSATGIPSPIELTRWSERSKSKAPHRSEIARWRKLWEGKRRGG